MKRLALLLALGGAACTGSITGGGPGGETPAPGNGSPGDPSNGGNDPSNPPGGPSMPNPSNPAAPPSAQVSCPSDGKSTVVGRRTLRRLTNGELETTIRTAFGLDAKQWTGLTVPPDVGSQDGFNNNVDQLTVSAEYARGTSESGRKVASLITADPLLTQLLPCAATGGDACAQTFLDTVGGKLYRRPLSPAEKTRYLALFSKVGKQADFRTSVYWATVAMLQSPNVIYRSELGESDGAGRFKLNPYEVASELSYTFTGGPPPAALLALAAANKLSTPDEVEAAARTLVLDGTQVKPAFRDVMMRFSEQWLGLSGLSNLKKDATAFPDFNSTIQDALGEETRRYVAAVLLEDKGSVASLITAPFTVVNPALAKYYGLPAGAGTDYARVNRAPATGIGLLAQGSLLSVKANSLKTSPTRRGHLVRSNLMCAVVPPPPPVVGDLPEPSEGETTRQRYESLHANDPGCKGCHTLMDPIGFAFEHLDASGRYRDKEGKFDIDDSGVLTGTTTGDLTFKGPTELANLLAKLPEVSDCVAGYAAAFAFGVSQENASCLVRASVGDLRGGMSVLDFYLKMSRADHFRLRQQ